MTAFTGAGNRGISGSGVALVTGQPVPLGGGVMPFGDGHGVGAFMAAGAVDGRKGHAVMTGIAGLSGEGRMQVMHGGGAVPRLALMTAGAIEPAGDPLDPLMAGAALVVQGRDCGMVHGRRAVFRRRLDGVTGSAGTFCHRRFGAAVTGGTVVAVVHLIDVTGVVHGSGTIPRLILMTDGAVEGTGDFLDPLVTGAALVVQGRCCGMVHGPRAVLGLGRMAGRTIGQCRAVHPDMAGGAITGRRRGGGMVHQRRTVDGGGLSAVTGGAVEPPGDTVDAGMAGGAIPRRRRGRSMVEGGNRLLVDGLGVAAFTLLRRRHQDGVGPVNHADDVAIEAGHAPGVLRFRQMMDICVDKGVTADAAVGFLDPRMATVAGAIVEIGQPMVTGLSGDVRPPAGMAAFTVDDFDDTGMTFGTVAAGGKGRSVMLGGGVAGGPAAGGMTAFAAAGGDDAGVTAVAAHRNGGVAEQIVVIGTDIGGPGRGGMTIGATASAGHADMTDGALLGLGGGSGVVLVTGVAGAPEPVAVTAFATAGIDDAGVAGIAAHRNSGVAQEVVMIATGVPGPGTRGMAAHALVDPG